MKAYLCVYRHPVPSKRSRILTEEAADSNPFLRKFIDQYFEANSLYDWGDDPSFFGATELLRDPRRATWGVCRPDVRESLSPGDFVVFVCGRQSETNARVWDYFFSGVATLKQFLTREEIWTETRYSPYRQFLNVLARPNQDGTLQQYEFVHKFHNDWLRRSEAPYWVFDIDDSLFNFENALHLATYHGQRGVIEKWHESTPRVPEVRALLLEGAKTTRGLRSINAQIPHPKLNLKGGYPSDRQLVKLRADLLDFVIG
jgi:hypothetical protein